MLIEGRLKRVGHLRPMLNRARLPLSLAARGVDVFERLWQRGLETSRLIPESRSIRQRCRQFFHSGVEMRPC